MRIDGRMRISLLSRDKKSPNEIVKGVDLRNLMKMESNERSVECLRKDRDNALQKPNYNIPSILLFPSHRQRC
jgi:hypothetical protein